MRQRQEGSRKEGSVRLDKAIPPPKTFDEYCLQFSQEKIPYIKVGRRYFYDPGNLLQYARDNKMDAFSAGLYLGEEKGFFQPTSALINMLAEHTVRTVVITDKAAWLFLCGRDVLMSGVVDSNLQTHGHNVIVCDIRDNILGTGFTMSTYDRKQKNKVFVKHRLDKGEYLRREK